MRTVLLSSVLALGLLATPAFAQSSNQGGSQNQGQSASSQQDSTIHAMSQDRLRKTLEQAGFKDVTVLDATYLVEAQSPHGDRVVMLIDPPSVGTMAGSGGSGGQQNQGQSNQQ